MGYKLSEFCFKQFCSRMGDFKNLKPNPLTPPKKNRIRDRIRFAKYENSKPKPKPNSVFKKKSETETESEKKKPI